jgi:hypothetical protein
MHQKTLKTPKKGFLPLLPVATYCYVKRRSQSSKGSKISNLLELVFVA